MRDTIKRIKIWINSDDQLLDNTHKKDYVIQNYITLSSNRKPESLWNFCVLQNILKLTYESPIQHYNRHKFSKNQNWYKFAKKIGTKIVYYY